MKSRSRSRPTLSQRRKNLLAKVIARKLLIGVRRIFDPVQLMLDGIGFEFGGQLLVAGALLGGGEGVQRAELGPGDG